MGKGEPEAVRTRAAWRLAEEVIAVRRVDLVDYEAASEGPSTGME